MTRSREAASAVRRIVARLAAILFLLAAASWPARAADAPQPALTIDSASGPHVFTYELARTEAERERGLMDRPTMPADHGMLFDMGEDKPVMMWMKDTLIPLDMLFIARSGRIVGIARRAVPMSEQIIPSPGPVRAVLELNGGAADRFKIGVGDTVHAPLFGN